MGMTMLGFRELKPLLIENKVLTMMKKSDSIGHLEVCKLEVKPTGSYLKTMCFLELPPPMADVFVILSDVLTEWVPTSKDYPRSRSSRGCHIPFYSSAIRTIALLLDYRTSPETSQYPYKCTVVISVEALLAAIRSGVRNVPWVDWGPSGTHWFEGTPARPAGPFWVTSLSPLVFRQYDLGCTRYTHTITGDRILPQALPQVFHVRGVFGKLRDEHSIRTNLPYRILVTKDQSFRGIYNLDSHWQIIANREWVVRVADPRVCGFSVYHSDGSLITGGDRDRKWEFLLPCIM
jgi:hypothetical protein